MITYLILLVISGLFVGALGRLAIPGPDPMGIGATIMVGIGGSFIGGLVGYVLFHRPARPRTGRLRPTARARPVRLAAWASSCTGAAPAIAGAGGRAASCRAA